MKKEIKAKGRSKNYLLSIFLCYGLIFSYDLSAQEWKSGVSLYTFHTVSFPDQLAFADSTGLKYVEGFTFARSGPAIKDSLIMNLSLTGIDKLNQQIKERGLMMESLYLVGGKTTDKWEKEFKLAKRFNVKYVTAEPPIHMLKSVDSLAAVYQIKVALHNHWKGASEYWHPDTVLSVLKKYPDFWACPDLGHWPKSGIDPFEGLKKLEGRILAVHLKDIAAYNDPTLKDVPVGTGVVDFPGVFKELKRQNFKGYIIIERDAEDKASNLASVMETIKYYKEQVVLIK